MNNKINKNTYKTSISFLEDEESWNKITDILISLILDNTFIGDEFIAKGESDNGFSNF